MGEDQNIQFKENLGCSEEWKFEAEAPEGIEEERWQQFTDDLNAAVKHLGRNTCVFIINIIAILILSGVVTIVCIVSFTTLTEDAIWVFIVAFGVGLALCFTSGAIHVCLCCAKERAFQKVEASCEKLTLELKENGSNLEISLTDVRTVGKHFTKAVKIRHKFQADETTEEPLEGNNTELPNQPDP
eukprot:symbB.v1.2.021884.t1/scaffold1919.1/size107341/4